MTTQLDVIKEVRSRVDEPDPHFFIDNDFRKWTNQACNDIARRTETLQATSTIPLVAGQQQYNAPSDTIRIYRIEHIDTSSRVVPLEYRDYNNADSVWWSTQLTITGHPLIWTAWGFPPSLKLVLYPLPDNSSDTIKVFYYRTPATLSDSTVADNTTDIEVPTGWETLVFDYVEYMALRKSRDPRWQEAKQLYEQGVQQMYEQTRRWTDQAGSFSEELGYPLHPFIWQEGWG